MIKIPFSKTFYTGKELTNISTAMDNHKLSGDGEFTKKCESFLEHRYNIDRVLLTTSCTDALELAAILCDIKPGDEVIIPSFTFPSTAVAFVLRGAKIIFCDSKKDHPNMNEQLLESLVTDKTKVIVPVHYGGVPCEMDYIMDLANKNNILVVEDAAQAIESSYKGKQLGSIGHLGTFSFHDTKNISAGEGGALLINDFRFKARAEIIREKGTNRKAFINGEINKYGWVDLGSSYLPSELNAAFLFAQLEGIDTIQKMRKTVWRNYSKWIKANDSFSTCDEVLIANSHLYYLQFNSEEARNLILQKLKDNEIQAAFHFLPLEKSDFIIKNYPRAEVADCPCSDHFSKTILRLPLFPELSIDHIKRIVEVIE